MSPSSNKSNPPDVSKPSVPAGWPEGFAYRAMRMRAVRVAVLLFALGLAYGVGRCTGGFAGHEGAESGPSPVASGEDEIKYWTCSMHPQIKLPKAGQCPICFMDLIPVGSGQGQDTGAATLELSPRARELARIETTEVEARQIEHEIRMVGKVAVDETRVTYISSYFPGRIDRLFVDYTGILVRKGDHLAEIYSPDLLTAQREYILALEAVERSRARTDQSDLDAASVRSVLESARRKLELWGIPKDEIDRLAGERKPSDHIRIDSPMEGWVVDRMGFEGMYVETGTRIFTLADLSSVWVMLDAYELDIGFIRLGQQVEFETEANPGRTFHGRVTFIDPVLRPQTRTLNVRLNVENPDLKLRPEMFVRARLKVELGAGGAVVGSPLAGKYVCYMHPEIVKDGPGQCDLCGMDLVPAESLGFIDTAQVEPKALAVPQTAVLLTGTRAVVYVEKPQKDRPAYQGRVVELGPRAGDYYIVKSGLAEGERVVTRGAIMIDSALQILAEPSMMQPAATGDSQPHASGVPAGRGPGEATEHEHHADAVQPTGGRPPGSSFALSGAEYQKQASPVIAAYLNLTAALANDDVESARRAAADLRKAAHDAKPTGLEGEARTAFAERMNRIVEATSVTGDGTPPTEGGRATDEVVTIQTLRQRLPAITAAMEAYLRSFGHDRRTIVYRAFCPMAEGGKGAYWLQAESGIRNAYFGASMLRCGEVKGVIGPDGKEQAPHD